MDSTANKFIELYKKATDTEYEIFEFKMNPIIQAGSQEYKQLEAKTEEFKKFKFELANISLSVEQAKYIITQTDKIADNHFSMSEINGADCYRFMNNGIKQNTQIALLAIKENPSNEKYIPEDVKKRLETLDMSKLSENLISITGAGRVNNPSQQQKQTTRLERKLGLQL